MATPSPRRTTAARVSGLLMVVALAAIAAILLALIYLLNPADDHVPALLEMGILSLVLAILSYFARALTSEPEVPQGASWAFSGLGFALIFLTLGLAPAGAISFLGRVAGLLLALVGLAGFLGGVRWSASGKARQQSAQAERARWASSPPVNALDYPTAATPAPAPASGPAAPGEHP